MTDTRKAFQRIQVRRGSLSNLPILGEAEPAHTRDSKELYVGGLPGDPNILLSRTAPEVLTALNYAEKNQVVFNKISGSGSLTFAPEADSSIGTGSFTVTGNGVWEIDRVVPFGPAEGIGGYVDFRSSVGTATVSFGATFFESDGETEISFNAIQNYFVANAVLSNSVFQHQNSGIIKGEGVIAGTFPTGARWLKPRLEISGNSGILQFDNFMLVPVRPVSSVFNIV